jgi:5-methylcytosine-specific restriction endonuclease McrA
MTQEALDNKSFSLDHIHPISLGGSDALENLAFCCQGCNSIKYNRMNGIDPETGELLPLFNPRKDKWTAHFRWNENFTVIFGITPTGRATVATLQLNRWQLINQRAVFRIAKVHPPAHSIT